MANLHPLANYAFIGKIMINVDEKPQLLVLGWVERVPGHGKTVPEQSTPLGLVELCRIPVIWHIHEFIRRKEIRSIIVPVAAHAAIRHLPRVGHAKDLVAKIIPAAVATMKRILGIAI